MGDIIMIEEVDTERRETRYVDMKIPLWGLMCALGAAAFFIISMYFTTNQTARDVGELQGTVKAGNAQAVAMAGEQALLRFRMENAEVDIRGLKHASPEK